MRTRSACWLLGGVTGPRRPSCQSRASDLTARSDAASPPERDPQPAGWHQLAQGCGDPGCQAPFMHGSTWASLDAMRARRPAGLCRVPGLMGALRRPGDSGRHASKSVRCRSRDDRGSPVGEPASSAADQSDAYEAVTATVRERLARFEARRDAAYAADAEVETRRSA